MMFEPTDIQSVVWSELQTMHDFKYKFFETQPIFRSTADPVAGLMKEAA